MLCYSFIVHPFQPAPPLAQWADFIVYFIQFLLPHLSLLDVPAVAAVVAFRGLLL